MTIEDVLRATGSVFLSMMDDGEIGASVLVRREPENIHAVGFADTAALAALRALDNAKAEAERRFNQEQENHE